MGFLFTTILIFPLTGDAKILRVNGLALQSSLHSRISGSGTDRCSGDYWVWRRPRCRKGLGKTLKRQDGVR